MSLSSDIIDKIITEPQQFLEFTSSEDLLEIYKKLRKMYYTEKSPVPDNLYELIENKVKEEYPNDPIFEQVGAPPKGVKYQLPYIMGSLDKIKGKDLNNYIKNYQGPYMVMDKLDGISVLYHQGNLYTRGNGVEGKLINHIIPYLRLPKISPNYAIRGELVINKKHKIENSRNVVAGIVSRRSSFDSREASMIDVIAYQILNPLMNRLDQLKTLEELGFKVVWYSLKNTLEPEELSEIILKRKEESPYEIDGLVIADYSDIYPLPTINRMNPRDSKAFKIIQTNQMADTTVLDIEWNISRLGRLKPILIINPVVIGGANISRVTGNNAQFVLDNKLGPGAQIIVIRSGDIIPKVHSILKTSEVEVLPDIEYQWDGPDLVTIEDSSEEQLKKLEYFFTTLNIANLGPKTLEKIYQAGFNTIKDIINLSQENLTKIERMGPKSSEKILGNIKNGITNVPLYKLMVASGQFPPGIGEKKLKELVSTFPNLFNQPPSIEQINELPGFSDKTSSKIVEGLKRFSQWFKDYPEITVIIPLDDSMGESSRKDLGEVVFSGFRDKELESKLEKQGYRISSNVNKNTKYLIVKDDNYRTTSKTEKAEKYGIDIINKEKFI